MTWTALTLLVCLAGHPDRCASYSLLYDGPPAACGEAAGQWLAGRPYLEPVRAECREEAGS
jgi:hypothetical protein